MPKNEEVSLASLGIQMPYSMQAEQSVLGAALVDETVLNRLITDMEPEMFYSDQNRAIYETMRSLYTESEAVDIVTLVNALASNKTFASAAAQSGGQAGHDLDLHLRAVLRQLQQRAGHAVDPGIAGADERHRLAALCCFQRPTAAVKFPRHAGSVDLFIRVKRAHKVDVDRVAAQHVGGLQGSLRLGGQILRTARAEAHHIHKTTVHHFSISNPGQRGPAPRQGSRRPAPTSG